MRQKSRLALAAAPCAAILAAALWLLPAFGQNTYGEPALGQPAYDERQELAVPFQHNAHNAKAKLTKCVACHHLLPGMKPPTGKKGQQMRSPTERRCADCHKLRPGPSDPASLMLVSHKLCQGCHKAKGKGPVNCAGCHKSEAAPAETPAMGAPTLGPLTAPIPEAPAQP